MEHLWDETDKRQAELLGQSPIPVPLFLRHKPRIDWPGFAVSNMHVANLSVTYLMLLAGTSSMLRPATI